MSKLLSPAKAMMRCYDDAKDVKEVLDISGDTTLNTASHQAEALDIGWRQVHSNAIQCILSARMLWRYDLNASGHCTTIGRSVKKFLPLGL